MEFRLKSAVVVIFGILILFGLIGVMEIGHLKGEVTSLRARSDHETNRVKRSCDGQPPTEQTTTVPVPFTQSSQGSLYFRWGSTKCGPNSKLIYAGIGGGGYYGTYGAAVNALCLPRDPELKDQQPAHTYRAFIYGMEYQDGPNHDDDVPCAVCYTGNRTANIMIPAKTTCPRTWQIEYTGMLMGGASKYAAGSEYLCVDESFETDEGGHENKDGKILYFAETVCGSLPCPTYENKKALPCVVCSK